MRNRGPGLGCGSAPATSRALRSPEAISIQNVLRGRLVEMGWQDGSFVEVNVELGGVGRGAVGAGGARLSVS